ncbi:alpha/beta hydrolase fold domain-containing protein [Pseudomonas gessardii]|uniref:Alpha/beta hydrolase fold domain-containing protein n=2 Tax=Pseudomonas gessardii TaxID=78544 RepID=A0ABS9FCD4_9PSED|nr:alpha/beta hydrolase fold domain-containing protein [Pseudomonas gessardii]MCF4993245.1 alpha/beta hydrolase fold domain-containing protein [Pseudomonas gessardii]MCF5085485.1 alpha/beta hydrolase fold domain-containing protein [Pseudomonas gessardii]MCF5097548.1 alpha/beta hydrolase fold domain-containing protein [Pseudomonas gessardii]MCF5110011.1 alpha/beta hydrolase fold domain-containing protein [Pseudomonas gessardii]
MAMSLTALERAYSPSSVAPDFMSVVLQYRALSDLMCTRHAATRIEYGQGADEYSILFEPTTQAASSMLVFIHGGYWQELSAQDSCFPAEGLLAHHIAYAAINYSLAPAANIFDMARQCCRALEALQAARPNCRIVIAGSSAGAHLAAMLLTFDWRAREGGQPPFAAALLISGIYDLRPLIPTYINTPLKLTLDSALALSPQLQPIVSPCPTVVCFGQQETDAFKQQSRDFAQRLISVGADVSLYEVPGRNHFDIVFDISQSATLIGADVLRLSGVPQ